MRTTENSQFITIIPSDVLFMSKPEQLAVYAVVRSFAGNGKGVCFASKKEIAIRAKVHRDTVYKQIEFLKKAGFIKAVGRKIRSIGGKPVEHLMIVDAGIPSQEKHAIQSNIPVSRNEVMEYAETKGTESLKVKQKGKQASIISNKEPGDKNKEELDVFVGYYVDLLVSTGQRVIRNRDQYIKSKGLRYELEVEFSKIKIYLDKLSKGRELNSSTDHNNWTKGSNLMTIAQAELGKFDPLKVKAAKQVLEKRAIDVAQEW